MITTVEKGIAQHTAEQTVDSYENATQDPEKLERLERISNATTPDLDSDLVTNGRYEVITRKQFYEDIANER